MNKLLFFLVITILAGCTSNQKEQSNEDITTLPLLDRIQLVDLDGKAIDLSEYKGKRVFLNLWATWCKPCLAEMPDLSRANDILSKEGYVFLAASDESMEKIESFVSEVDYSFQFVKMKNTVYDLEVPALPTSLIINSKGELVYNETGAKDWDTEAELEILRRY